MKLKIINTSLLMTMALSGASSAQAFSLSDWIGSNVAALSANFDRYDVDLKTGKINGPIKGHLELQRPGLLIVDMQGQQVNISGDYLKFSACANCKPNSLSAAGVIGKPLLELIAYGTNAEDLLTNTKPSSVGEGDSLNSRWSYSLAPMGLGQSQFTLWSYSDQPTVIELSLTSGVKTIFQLYGLQRSMVGVGEKK